MTPILRFIAGGWTFLWRQPALRRSMFFLVFLPLLLLDILDPPFRDAQPEHRAVLVVLTVAVIIFLTWGTACTLTVGKRLLQAKAGRQRTSFRAVQAQARGLIVSLLLTDILRSCTAILWALPLIGFVVLASIIADEQDLTPVAFLQHYPWLIGLALLFALPPIRYLLQTILAPFVIAYEKLAFRPALERSRALTRGRLPRTMAIIAILALLWVPGLLIESLLLAFPQGQSTLFAIPIITAFFDTFALTLWLLTLTQYMKALGGKVVTAAITSPRSRPIS